MSQQYDIYLEQHKAGVAKAFYWMQENLSEILARTENLEHKICYAHDFSKNDPDEYGPYDAYFYGGNRSYQVVQNFNRAWLAHIHKNSHHWQHYVLIHDDPNEPMDILDMPYDDIVEMICDWWSFSWNKGNLYEIFTWYDEHKEYMKLSRFTRRHVETILSMIKIKLKLLEDTQDDQT